MAQQRLELVGKRFGKLLVVKVVRCTPRGMLWHCICDCGAETELVTGNLTSGNTRSCGCLKREMVAAKNYRHGLLRRGNQSPEFNAYLNAMSRCENPDNKCFANYGGRGIRFRFVNFEEFFMALGPRPSRDHSVDRKDNDGDYEPENVHWATRSEQQRNRRHNARKGHQGFLSRTEIANL